MRLFCFCNSLTCSSLSSGVRSAPSGSSKPSDRPDRARGLPAPASPISSGRSRRVPLGIVRRPLLPPSSLFHTDPPAYGAQVTPSDYAFEPLERRQQLLRDRQDVRSWSTDYHNKVMVAMLDPSLQASCWRRLSEKDRALARVLLETRRYHFASRALVEAEIATIDEQLNDLAGFANDYTGPAFGDDNDDSDSASSSGSSSVARVSSTDEPMEIDDDPEHTPKGKGKGKSSS